MINFFDIGKQVIELLSELDDGLQKTERKDYFLGRSHESIGEYQTALKFYESYLVKVIK